MSNYTHFFAPHYIKETDPEKLVSAFEETLGEKIERCIAYHESDDSIGHHYSNTGIIKGYFIGQSDENHNSLYDLFFEHGYSIDIANKKGETGYSLGPHFVHFESKYGVSYLTLMDYYFGIAKHHGHLASDKRFLDQMHSTKMGFEDSVLPFYIKEAKRLGLNRLYVTTEYYEVHFDNEKYFIEPTEEELLRYIKKENIPFHVLGEDLKIIDRDEKTERLPLIQVNFNTDQDAF